MLPILLLHSFRHLGLMFLAPERLPGDPSPVRLPAAFGDLVAALLAVVSIPLVMTSARSVRLLVWIFNLAGTGDLLIAISLATIH